MRRDVCHTEFQKEGDDTKQWGGQNQPKKQWLRRSTFNEKGKAPKMHEFCSGWTWRISHPNTLNFWQVKTKKACWKEPARNNCTPTQRTSWMTVNSSRSGEKPERATLLNSETWKERSREKSQFLPSAFQEWGRETHSQVKPNQWAISETSY